MKYFYIVFFGLICLLFSWSNLYGQTIYFHGELSNMNIDNIEVVIDKIFTKYKNKSLLISNVSSGNTNSLLLYRKDWVLKNPRLANWAIEQGKVVPTDDCNRISAIINNKENSALLLYNPSFLCNIRGNETISNLLEVISNGSSKKFKKNILFISGKIIAQKKNPEFKPEIVDSQMINSNCTSTPDFINPSSEELVLRRCVFDSKSAYKFMISTCTDFSLESLSVIDNNNDEIKRIDLKLDYYKNQTEYHNTSTVCIYITGYDLFGKGFECPPEDKHYIQLEYINKKGLKRDKTNFYPIYFTPPKLKDFPCQCR